MQAFVGGSLSSNTTKFKLMLANSESIGLRYVLKSFAELGPLSFGLEAISPHAKAIEQWAKSTFGATPYTSKSVYKFCNAQQALQNGAALEQTLLPEGKGQDF